MSPDKIVDRNYLPTHVAPETALLGRNPSTNIAPVFPTRRPEQTARLIQNSDDISFHVELDSGPGFTVTGSAEDYARVFRCIAPDTVLQAPAAPKAERSLTAPVNTTRCLECDKEFRIEGSTYYSM